MLLIDDLLLLPIKGFFGIFKKIAEKAEEEYYSEDKIKESLMQLQILLDAEQITQKEYDQQEKRLLKRLEEIRKYKQSK